MARPAGRVQSAVRFDRSVHEALKETADELGVGMNWLVNRLCAEGLERMELTSLVMTKRPRPS